MRKSTILLLILLFIIIPINSNAAGNCVLTGKGSQCLQNYFQSKYSTCYTSSPLSCSANSRGTSVRVPYETCTYKTATGICIGPKTSYKTVIREPYSNSYTIKLEEETCGNSTVLTSYDGNINVTYWRSWRVVDHNAGPYRSVKPTMRNVSAGECIAYAGQHEKNGYYYYDDVYSRCCDGRGASKPDKPPVCYRRKISDTSYDYKWAIDSPGAGYTAVNGIKTESECVINNPNYCEASIINSPINREINSCSGKIDVSLQDGNKCQIDSSSNFYSIACNENLVSDFQAGFEGNSVRLIAGQGFNYDISLTSVKKCSGTFDVTEWNKSYNLVEASIRRARVTNDAKEIAYYESIKKNIVDIVNTYNKWVITNNSEYTADIKIDYLFNKKTKTYNDTFIQSNVKETKKERSNNNCQTLSNGMQVCSFTTELTKSVTLIPKKVYIDKNSGEITNKIRDVIDAGNKIYTDLKTDTGNYQISLSVHTSGNNQVTINNNACNLDIYNQDIDYRIIDVSNPFVNKDREIGSNWSSKTYNYTNVIKNGIWNNEPLYVFNLSRNDILKIKNSNRNNNDAYLGTCNLSVDLQDEAIRNVCQIINSK